MKLIDELRQFKPHAEQDASGGEDENFSEEESFQGREIGKDIKLGRLCISNPFTLLEDEY